MLKILKKNSTLIFILAIILRIGYIYFFLGFNTPPNDHDFWLEKVALNISHGGGYGLTSNTSTARKLPLFSLFLAGVYFIFGHNIIIARLFQILLGALSVLGIYLIAKLINKENKHALIAGIILACDPLYVYLSGWFLTENLFVFLIVWFIYFLLKYQFHEQKQKYLILAGISLGLASLTRANFMLFPIFIYFWSYINNKNNALKNTLIISTIMYIFIFGWVIRNYMVLGEIITTETGSGKMFWGSNNQDAIGDVILMTGSPRLYETGERPRGIDGKDWRMWQGSPWLNVFLSEADGISEKQVNDKYFKKGWAWIKENPLDFISLAPKKIFYFWKFWSPHASLPDLDFNLFLTAKIYYYFILFFAVIGLYFSFNVWKNYLILYLLLGNFTLSTILFFGDARQRIPTLPILAIFAGVGISRVLKKF